MDPMTQSAQISSSQGFADGQNSAAKESKLSDSFLSSSPVSLIQSPQVKDLIHWRDPKKSGLVFGLSMLLLLSLAAFSVISVASYLLLALLCVTITFRIYKSVVQAVQKSNEGHPFKTLIDKDVSIPPETFRKHVDASLTYINRALKQMSRLFLVEDLVDSLKVSSSAVTDILLFAVPPIYEKNKTQIDQYIDLARTQVNTTITKLQEKLPGAVKRSKTE
uniref:Reticulon n=1 Tax=Amphiprion ocellaris TaxID=80972 RepID=A0AAQ5X878_AMPOC